MNIPHCDPFFGSVRPDFTDCDPMPPKAPKIDKRLRGTWRSDSRRTIAEWRFTKRVTPKKRLKFFSLFGKLRLTYTPTRIRGVLGEYEFTQRYERLATDSDSVAIRYEDLPIDSAQVSGNWQIQHIHFEGPDHYWISLGGHREWFKRVQ